MECTTSRYTAELFIGGEDLEFYSLTDRECLTIFIFSGITSVCLRCVGERFLLFVLFVCWLFSLYNPVRCITSFIAHLTRFS